MLALAHLYWKVFIEYANHSLQSFPLLWCSRLFRHTCWICNSVVVPTVLCRNGSKFWLVKIRPLAGEVSIATMITGIVVCLAATILKARFCRMSFAMNYTCLIYVLWRFPWIRHRPSIPLLPRSFPAPEVTPLAISRALERSGDLWRHSLGVPWRRFESGSPGPQGIKGGLTGIQTLLVGFFVV